MSDRKQLQALGEARPPTSEHGPCTSGGAQVRDNLPTTLSAENRQWCLARLDFGEQKYGAPLLIDWPKGEEALAEELADAINYAVVCGRLSMARKLGKMLNEL